MESVFPNLSSAAAAYFADSIFLHQAAAAVESRWRLEIEPLNHKSAVWDISQVFLSLLSPPHYSVALVFRVQQQNVAEKYRNLHLEIFFVWR